MRRCICPLSYGLLILALLGNRSLPASAAPADDPKSAPQSASKEEKSKTAEKASEAQKAEAAKKTAEAKPGQQAKPPVGARKPPAAKPSPYTVKKQPLKIEVTLSGVFEAQKMTEIALEPEAWSSFKVVSAVEHGTQVKQGDLLVSLDREKIDRAISDLRADHEAADLALKLAERQLATLEKTTPMNLATGERNHKEAQEDLKYYFDVRRPLALKSAEFSLKYAQEEYEYQKEELRQLEKMYAADDLTEETEEIILRRARNALRREEFYLEQSKIYHDRDVNVLIPRDDVSIREAAQHIDLLWKETKVALPVKLKQQRLALAKLKQSRERSEENLKKLLADRAAMTIKAPTAGVVYYGRCVRGKFSSSSSASTSIRPGSSLMPKQVVMTIVKPRPMFIRTSVAEKQLHQVHAGIKGTAVPTGYPEMKLTAIVERVAAVPTGSGSFDARITVALDQKAEPLMPSMTCKVTLVSYENKEALTIPPSHLKTDEADKEKHYVYLLTKKDKVKKQYVKVGKRTASKVEILKGLAEGDKVLPEEPKKEKPSEEKKEPPKDKQKPAENDKPPKEKKDAPKEEKDATKDKKDVPKEEKNDDNQKKDAEEKKQ